MSLTTPALTLTPSWTATVSSCTKSDDWWVWNYDDVDGNDAWVVIGGPSQVTDCYPSGYGASATYAGSQCPSGFTQVSATVLDPDVVCCPTVKPFSYITSTVYREETFRCGSMFTADVTSSLTSTDFSLSTQVVTKTTIVPGQHLFALAIIYTTPTSSPTTAASTTPSATPSINGASGSSSLAAGAAAGIGVGATLIVLLLAVGVVGLVWRKRRRQRRIGRWASSLPSPPRVSEDLHPHAEPLYSFGRGSQLKEGVPRELELAGQGNLVNALSADRRVKGQESAELQG
ncbi:uncharacterized protein PV06_04876 [Exophiala oligosperma]|uniref:Uncharacterized protein n=1 Tax=Exophiala oligosperma TaxID=215243 RepID=A0A0D2C231_9EURO|nr:uncharacterized protein PV06_04876 [Exophiala oligosperma]KIW43812.1 hypothetical protein PV06_04876 [Exophiala oligosperma]